MTTARHAHPTEASRDEPVEALVDTHAHLDSRQFDQDREQVIARALEAGVGLVINAGADLASSQASVSLAERYACIYASVGVHPHAASAVDDDTLDQLTALADHPRVVAIGEIGLDYYRDLSPRPNQREAFRQQLDLAGSLAKPVIIHSRDAHQETLEILREWLSSSTSRGLPHPVGVMHCFSGSVEMAKQLLELGFMIGVDGPVTFGNARRLPEIIAWMPLDRLLLETDCPYLAPHPFRGKRNEPAYLPWVARRIAEMRGASGGEIAEATTANARALFRLGDGP